MTRKLTREERVQSLYGLKIGQVLNPSDIESIKMLARMALAAMDSEPVIVVGDDGWDALSYRRLIQSFEPGTKLYLHAQLAPVVPEEAYSDDCPELYPSQPDAWAAGWNACRAAMLAATLQSPGSEPATVPGKWIPVSERMPPRIPGTSIEYLVYETLNDNVQHDYWNVPEGNRSCQAFWNHYGDSVTHWQPLPEPPQETKP